MICKTCGNKMPRGERFCRVCGSGGSVREDVYGVIREVKKAVTGKDDCICKAFAAILAGGHILIEDVPGVGKTTLVMAFSKALSLETHRMQFTPDVMPADILGFNTKSRKYSVLGMQRLGSPRVNWMATNQFRGLYSGRTPRI